MPNTPTPGQVAYDAWYALHSTGSRYEGPRPWSQLQSRTHDVWEAVAQAVLDAWQAQPRLATPGRTEHDHA